MPVVEVLDSTMYYEDEGDGTPLVFLHGNPTSSHLWRRVLAALEGPGRRLAPDLIGMGASGKPNIPYRFAYHARYLDAWFSALDLDGVVLVGHDWGGALAFDWARRHPSAVRGVAFLETIVRPVTWSDFGGAARQLFESFRTPGKGEQIVLNGNAFIEQALPNTMISKLAAADWDAYRRPYPTAETRRPLLQWPRELPIDGEPANVVERAEAYNAWLASTPHVPKLLFAFEPGPGTMIRPELVDWCRKNIAALEVAQCGRAGHHAPEDQPDTIAAALTAWCDRHALLAGGATPRPVR